MHHAVHWAWIILLVCFFNLFINYSVRLGYGVVLPEMIKDLGLSRTGGGSIYNAYLVTYITLTPFTGYLTDRFGARRVISICALILGLGVLLMGTVQSLGAACLAYAVVGIGATGMWTPVLTVVQRWFALKRRGLALGILSTGYGLGFATMGVVFPFIVASLNWRFAWYFLGIGALIMVVLNAVFLRSDPESSGKIPWGSTEKGTHPSVRPAVADNARISLWRQSPPGR
ncbi:MAG: MFS transporter [Desulfovermiculus sp.]